MKCPKVKWFLGISALILGACENQTTMKTYQDIQLTHDASGHQLNSTQVFSPDNQWIVYDVRNEETGINEVGEIAMVHTETGEIKTLYRTQNQTSFGPGVAAVTFSPTANRVLFIHGIRNANEANPYAMTRRTGVAIDIEKPFVPLFLDARNISVPFTNGALRGGTHAHTWSGDGKWISFTYNDYCIEQAAKQGQPVKDLRTIGVMLPGKQVYVQEDQTLENNSGELFSTLVAKVVDIPTPETDEIDKAFDECWIGKNGYQKADGTHQNRALAYQGNVVNALGETITQIFVADLPDDLLDQAQDLKISDNPAERLPIVDAIQTRRITHLTKGVSPLPRHWLRSSADGQWIGFLSKENTETVQLYVVNPATGETIQLTNHEFSIDTPFNFSADGKRIAYIADGSVFITEIATKSSVRVTSKVIGEGQPFGTVVWSNDDSMLAYNRVITSEGSRNLQIFLLK